MPLPLSCRTKRFFVLAHPDEESLKSLNSRPSLVEEEDETPRNCLCGSATTHHCIHHIFLDVDCDYTRRMISEAFTHPKRRNSFRVTLGAGHGMEAVPLPQGCHFQWAEYERIDWSSVLDGKHGASSYCIRKGLSRKAQLAHFVKRYVTKNPGSVLTRAIPDTLILDTWAVWDDHRVQGSNCEGFAGLITSNGPVKAVNLKDRLLFCLDEARRRMEIADSEFEKGEARSEPIWILKGSTTNKGSGIYIIHVFEQLVDICWSESDIREW
jgi:tubulin---tyrosine ligase